MTVGIIGSRTSVARALVEMLPEAEMVYPNTESDDCDRYLIAIGFLAGKAIGDQSQQQILDGWERNFIEIAARCDDIIENNPRARICIIGSESGISGSFDMAYAGAKAALHLYIETKRLEHPDQQLVGIAPTIIRDSGMTQRRTDLDACLGRGLKRRRREWLNAVDVARLAYFLLYVDQGTITNTVIRQNGGNW